SFALRIAAFAAILAFVASSSAALADSNAKVHRSSKLSSTSVRRGYGKLFSNTPGPVAWGAEGYETLPNGLCPIDGGQPADGRRTLVIFLHGMIAKDVDWQWLQERALARQAKQSKFEAIFARAPLGPGGYVWPGSLAAQEGSEQALIDEWNAARAFL